MDAGILKSKDSNIYGMKEWKLYGTLNGSNLYKTANQYIHTIPSVSNMSPDYIFFFTQIADKSVILNTQYQQIKQEFVNLYGSLNQRVLVRDMRYKFVINVKLK